MGRYIRVWHIDFRMGYTLKLSDTGEQSMRANRTNNNNKNTKIYEVNIKQGLPAVDTAMNFDIKIYNSR